MDFAGCRRAVGLDMVESLGKETDLVGYGGEVRKGDRLVFIQEPLEIIFSKEDRDWSKGLAWRRRWPRTSTRRLKW